MPSIYDDPDYKNIKSYKHLSLREAATIVADYLSKEDKSVKTNSTSASIQKELNKTHSPPIVADMNTGIDPWDVESPEEIVKYRRR